MHLFDEGWNRVRVDRSSHQKRLGIMPENAKLTPWPKELPEWDSLGLLEKTALSSSKPMSWRLTSLTRTTRSDPGSSRRSKTSGELAIP